MKLSPRAHGVDHGSSQDLVSHQRGHVHLGHGDREAGGEALDGAQPGRPRSRGQPQHHRARGDALHLVQQPLVTLGDGVVRLVDDHHGRAGQQVDEPLRHRLRAPADDGLASEAGDVQGAITQCGHRTGLPVQDPQHPGELRRQLFGTALEGSGRLLEQLLLVGHPEDAQLGLTLHLLQQPVHHREGLARPGREDEQAGAAPRRAGELVERRPRRRLMVVGLARRGRLPREPDGLGVCALDRHTRGPRVALRLVHGHERLAQVGVQVLGATPGPEELQRLSLRGQRGRALDAGQGELHQGRDVHQITGRERG